MQMDGFQLIEDVTGSVQQKRRSTQFFDPDQFYDFSPQERRDDSFASLESQNFDSNPRSASFQLSQPFLRPLESIPLSRRRKTLETINNKSSDEKSRLVVGAQPDEQLNLVPEYYFSESDFLQVRRSDLTNKLINYLGSLKSGMPYIIFFFYLDFICRVYSYVYIFVLSDFTSKSVFWFVYLLYAVGPRTCYLLALLKLLFKTTYEDIFLERIARRFNEFDYQQVFLEVDYSSMDSSILLNNLSNNIQYKTDHNRAQRSLHTKLRFFIAVLKRLVFAITPVELSFIPIYCIFKENDQRSLMVIILNFIYKGFEYVIGIVVLWNLYFIDMLKDHYWCWGPNYSSIAFGVFCLEFVKYTLFILFLFLK